MEEYQVIQENIYDEIETVREAKSQSLVYGAEVASGIKGETLSSSREFSVRASLETIYNPNKFGFWQKDEASGNKEITEINKILSATAVEVSKASSKDNIEQ